MNAPSRIGVQIHSDYEQGSALWMAARCGLLTSSEFDRILTPPKAKEDGGWTGLKIADNPKSRSHLWEMAAQRITGFVEPQYVSDAMLRGQADEILARELYAKHFALVQECGFVTNNKWGFTLGCSPDGLVGNDGLIEVKSRCQKYQVETIVDGKMPDEYALQVQGQMLVTERKWADFISYCGGLPMVTMRVLPDPVIQEAILDAAAKFESRINEVVADWTAILESDLPLIPTERVIEQEMYLG